MDPDLLRAFVAVAESGGFTAAARALNRTQSAVSLQIKRLEDQVGDPLFLRTSRSVELTDTGGTLLPYARRILRLQDEAAAAVDALTQSRSLRFGISDEQALVYLPKVIAEFGPAYPDVQLEIVCDLSTNLVKKMEEGDLDLALAIRHGPTASGEIIGHEKLVWVAREDFRQNPMRPLPLALNPEGCIYRAFGLSALARIQRRWNVVYLSPNPTGINLALEAGMAVTIKASRSVPDGCRILDGETGIPPLPPVEIELHRAATAFTEAADGFVRLLLREVAAAEDVSVLPAAMELAENGGGGQRVEVRGN